jgi:hypothetical protein
MSIHLYQQAITGASTSSALRVLAAYENGSVVLREYRRSGKDSSVEGQGWDVIWKAKLHVETSSCFHGRRYSTRFSFEMQSWQWKFRGQISLH